LTYEKSVKTASQHSQSNPNLLVLEEKKKSNVIIFIAIVLTPRASAENFSRGANGKKTEN